MKKKFIIFTLCFTLIFSSLNYKKVNAIDFVITPSMFYTVSALTVAYGLSITDTDALYNMSYEFVKFCGDTYADVKDLFNSSVSVVDNVVSVGKGFLDKFNDFLTVNKPKYDVDDIDYTSSLGGLPIYFGYEKQYFSDSQLMPALAYSFNNSYISYNDSKIYVNGIDSGCPSAYFDKDYTYLGMYSTDYNLHAVFSKKNTNYKYHVYLGNLHFHFKYSIDHIDDGYKNPFVGTYDDTIVNGNLSDSGSLGLVLNPNVDSLIGKNPSDVIYDGTNVGTYDGTISVPDVSNPSINVEGDLFFPNVGVIDPSVPSDPSVPNEGVWSNITDYIIGLVVPSDTFWTDTWGGMYNNFTNSFPMIDMDGFNDLVTGEKKFPNIDINIMGVNGRVVNGDVINSIVDWLRPIIAGFIMICLMLFNYRKIYKLIRNSEPFGGIASGTSDFRTGISEYKHDFITPTGLSMPYEDYLEHSKSQRKWEMANPGKDYGKAGFTKVD